MFSTASYKSNQCALIYVPTVKVLLLQQHLAQLPPSFQVRKVDIINSTLGKALGGAAGGYTRAE